MAVQTAAIETAAIGFSPHSGWAAMVVLGGTSAAPTLLARSRVPLIDDHDLESKQPYHAVEFLCVEEATGRLDGYMAVATGMAQAALRAQFEELQGRDISVKSVGIVDLRLPLDRMLDTVNKLGREKGPPWGADQKNAAL